MKIKNKFADAGAVLAWFAVIAQAVLIIQNREAGIGETLVKFFSFFTVLSNLIVAICFTANAKNASGNNKSFFSRPSVQTAILVYITVVGLVYNTILRFIWDPAGLQRVVDELLHLVVPVLYIIYWCSFVQKIKFSLNSIFYWLIFPFIYLVWVLSRGAITNQYPYPFMDVTTLGYHKVFINSFLILMLFLFLSFLMLIISRTLARPGENSKQD